MEIYENFIREAGIIDGEDGYPFWGWYIKSVPVSLTLSSKAKKRGEGSLVSSFLLHLITRMVNKCC